MSTSDILLRKLNARTLTILKQIARQCGLASSGTKPILAQRISQGLQTPLLRPLPKDTPHRILSIDMGIRNLALCLLHIPSSQVPQITNWNRITVSQKPESVTESSSAESFEPLDYAEKAYTLIKQSLDKFNPHTILIERQRYRSGGGAAVQEWTVRVNMLESMFHAILYTLSQQQNNHDYDFVVHSVSPKRITQLWLADCEEKLNARRTKAAKNDVAERIIKGNYDDVNVEIVGQAKEIAEGFNCGEKALGVKKFDDLADSMLQGLGWWKWHVNRLMMLQNVLEWEDSPKLGKLKESAMKTMIRSRGSEASSVSITSSGSLGDNTKSTRSKEMEKTQQKKALEIL